MVSATVMDVAEIRAYKCLLPDDVPVGEIAARLAELTHMPVVGPDNYPLTYGFVVKAGTILHSQVTFKDLNLPKELTMRLVPEFTAGQEMDVEPDVPADTHEQDLVDPPDIQILEERYLVHDLALDTRPDIRVNASVHHQIEDFAAQDRNTECAGLLLGQVEFENGKRVVHITAIAPAGEAVGNRTSVKMTMGAWESLLRIRDRDYADLRVLGWFHTHAGWGVFMSDSDVFVHRHFFTHPSMVAFVLDPVLGRDGFFYWHDGKIGLAPNYGLMGSNDEVEPFRHRKAKKKLRLDVKSLAIICLVGAVGYMWASHSIDAKNASLKPTPVVNGKPETDKLVTREKTQPMVRIYVIGKGDNPWLICNRVYNDGGLAEALAEYNGLEDLSGLQVGQEIKLPPKSVLKKLASE